MKKACVAMMKKAIRLDALPLHQVPKTSPMTSMTDKQWDELVEHWKIEKKMVISSNYATSHHVDFICA